MKILSIEKLSTDGYYDGTTSGYFESGSVVYLCNAIGSATSGSFRAFAVWQIQPPLPEQGDQRWELLRANDYSIWRESLLSTNELFFTGDRVDRNPTVRLFRVKDADRPRVLECCAPDDCMSFGEREAEYWRELWREELRQHEPS